MAQAESRLELDTERLDAASEAQRDRLAALETQFARAAGELSQSSQEQLEAHERDRRRALHEVAERLRQRERELRDRIAAEEAEAIQRIQAGFADIERRQLDQLKRVVERTAASFSEAVSKQFADAIRGARDDAAQRLSRELDRAVQHFAKEAQSVLADRLAHVADAGGQRLERKLSQIGTTLEHERDELMAELQRRIGDAEVELRSQVQSRGGLRPGSVLGGLELGATLASALVAVTGIFSGWSYWVVGAAVLVAVWLSTRLALRSTRVRASNKVDSRRR